MNSKNNYQIGDRVKNNATGAKGTITDFGTDEGKTTYIVKYDEMQRRPDGFEYQNEEVFAEEISITAKYILSITAHTKMDDNGNSDSWCLWSKEFDKNITNIGITNHCPPVLDRLLTLMPCGEWTIDDGEDVRGTDYCQYVWYEGNNPETGNYLLGAWYEIDEQTGCMK